MLYSRKAIIKKLNQFFTNTTYGVIGTPNLDLTKLRGLFPELQLLAVFEEVHFYNYSGEVVLKITLLPMSYRVPTPNYHLRYCEDNNLNPEYTDFYLSYEVLPQP
jgi:hypothetical protein